jgi:hypothetical protein
MDMAAAVRELNVRRDPRPTGEEDPKEVVAVVLADGTVRELRGARNASTERRRYTSGTVSGSDWTLWWDRRSYA